MRAKKWQLNAAKRAQASSKRGFVASFAAADVVADGGAGAVCGLLAVLV
jgi:hypothetical protein